MKPSNIDSNFSVSQDSKHQLFAGIIRNQVLTDEFNLHDIDFSSDQYDTADNAFYLLFKGQCVGCCRVIARRECSRLPVEDYIDLNESFGIDTKAELNSTCEFSRLAILPEYQGAKGASLLIEAVAQHAIQRGLMNLVYCSNAEKMHVFSLIAQRKDLYVHLDAQEFQYVGVNHATFQAALVKMNLSANGERRVIRNAG